MAGALQALRSKLDGYNDGLSAAEEMPGSVEPRLTPALAQAAEFVPAELETVDGGWGRAVLGRGQRGRQAGCRANGYDTEESRQ